MNIELGKNEVGVEGIQCLLRAKWSNIKTLGLGKTDQI
jgi:hypothetical protein